MTVFLFTGPIQSGKSTELLNRYQNQKNVGGFLSLVVGDKRNFYSFSQQIQIPMELPESDADLLPVGRFRFSKKAFETAENWFENDLKSKQMKWMILDEIGPLELQDKGFSQLVSNYLSNPENPGGIFVVRENLVESVLAKWSFDHLTFQVVSQGETDQLPETAKR